MTNGLCSLRGGGAALLKSLVAASKPHGPQAGTDPLMALCPLQAFYTSVTFSLPSRAVEIPDFSVCPFPPRICTLKIKILLLGPLPSAEQAEAMQPMLCSSSHSCSKAAGPERALPQAQSCEPGLSILPAAPFQPLPRAQSKFAGRANSKPISSEHWPQTDRKMHHLL